MKNFSGKKNQNAFVILKKNVFLQPHFSNDGALAQLARAFDWQSRGREFDSHTLHTRRFVQGTSLFFCGSSLTILLFKKRLFVKHKCIFAIVNPTKLAIFALFLWKYEKLK